MNKTDKHLYSCGTFQQEERQLIINIIITSLYGMLENGKFYGKKIKERKENYYKIILGDQGRPHLKGII